VVLRYGPRDHYSVSLTRESAVFLLVSQVYSNLRGVLLYFYWRRRFQLLESQDGGKHDGCSSKFQYVKFIRAELFYKFRTLLTGYLVFRVFGVALLKSQCYPFVWAYNLCLFHFAAQVDISSRFCVTCPLWFTAFVGLVLHFIHLRLRISHTTDVAAKARGADLTEANIVERSSQLIFPPCYASLSSILNVNYLFQRKKISLQSRYFQSGVSGKCLNHSN
jgi:hypothetical protein